MPRVLVPVGAAAALLVLVLAAAVWAQGVSESPLDESEATLVATQAVVADHASVMREQGERLLRAVDRSTGAHRTRWITGTQMTADATRLEDRANARQPRRAPRRAPGAEHAHGLSFLHATGNGLVADGGKLAAHGRAMRKHTLPMEELARVGETDITEEPDLTLIERALLEPAHRYGPPLRATCPPVRSRPTPHARSPRTSGRPRKRGGHPPLTTKPF